MNPVIFTNVVLCLCCCFCPESCLLILRLSQFFLFYYPCRFVLLPQFMFYWFHDYCYDTYSIKQKEAVDLSVLTLDWRGLCNWLFAFQLSCESEWWRDFLSLSTGHGSVMKALQIHIQCIQCSLSWQSGAAHTHTHVSWRRCSLWRIGCYGVTFMWPYRQCWYILPVFSVTVVEGFL